MKLSLRDKIAGGADTWDVQTGVANQNRGTKTPSLEEFQRGFNKAKPSNNQTPNSPPTGKLPQLVKRIKEWVKDPNGFMGIFQDENGNQVKVVSKDKSKVFWRSDYSAYQTAFVAERKRRINAAVYGIKIKASKEDWIAAREKLIEKLMDKVGYGYDEAEHYLNTPEGSKMMENAAYDYSADKIDYLQTMNGI